MFSSPRRKKTASPGGTPGGIAFDAKSVLKHDVGKERKFRTKVHRKTLDPVFNELFIVHGVLGTLIAGPLEVNVLDSDAISKDDPLGTLELDLSPLGAEGGDDSLEWASAPLQDVAHGTLSVRVSWAENAKTGRHALASTKRLEQHGTLSVHVIEASNLIAADGGESSDPYVKLKLTGVPKGNVLQQVRERGSVAIRDVKQGVSVLATESVAKVETAAETTAAAASGVASSVSDKVRKMRRVEVPSERVDEPTPEELYFTPRNGWTEAKKAHDRLVRQRKQNPPPGDSAPTGEDGAAADWDPPPPSLVPSMSEADALYHDEGIIGELWVEVLEAEHLLDGGALDAADPYAVLVVEGNAARTATVRDNNSPRWRSDSPRAFRFPIRRPYACLYIGLMDDDKSGTLALSALNDDDPLGRVVVPLGRLASDTVYDSWYFVQFENTQRHAGTLGALRVRLSVRYPSERARLLAYVKPFPDIQPPGARGGQGGASAVVPFQSKGPWRSALNAVHGKASREYDPTELKVYLVELTSVLGGPLDVLRGLRRLLFWQVSVPLSLTLLVGWQWLVSYPHLTPAAICFALAMALQHSLHLNGERTESKGAFGREGDPASAISAQPGILALLAALAFDRRPAPLTVDPDAKNDLDPTRVDAEQEGAWLYESCDGLDSDSGEEEGQGKASGGVARRVLGRKKKKKKKNVSFKEVLGLGGEGGGLLEALIGDSGDLHTHRMMVRAELHKDNLAEEEKSAIKERRRSGPSMSVSSVGTALNPMASVLGVVQPLLRDLLCALRGLERVLVWTDRRLTLWLWLGLLASSALLAILASFIPWGFVFGLLMRLVGLAIFGPHMIWVGRWLDEKTAVAMAKEEEYDLADDKRQKAMLDEVRKEVEEEDRLADEKEQELLKQRPEWMKAKQKYLKSNKYNLLMRVPKVPSQKIFGVPDPARSRAEPLETPTIALAADVASAPTEGGGAAPVPVDSKLVQGDAGMGHLL